MTESGRRMFAEVTGTWNPWIGCDYGCVYCWARPLALGKLNHLPRYSDGFRPKPVPHELRRRFRQGFVFVSDMGDMWAPWVPAEDIRRVLAAVGMSPNATFLFLTKNPGRYHEFMGEMPPNVVLGATIETNLYPAGCRISGAPPPFDRWLAMCDLNGFTRIISLEPVLRFDLNVFPEMLRRAAPDWVYIGYDNYSHKLPEPSLADVRLLMECLGSFTQVKQKTIRPAWWEYLE